MRQLRILLSFLLLFTGFAAKAAFPVKEAIAIEYGVATDACSVSSEEPDGWYWSIKRAVSYDANAQAYMTAVEGTGVTLTTAQKNAINNFVVALKGYGLWTKCYAIYTFIGGTASSCKFNLKDPQDTNGAYRLVWTGTFTYNTTGVVGNGTNGYAETFFNPTTAGVTDNFGITLYSRTAASLSCLETGTSGNTASEIGRVATRNGGLLSSVMFSTSTTVLSVSSSDGSGRYIFNKLAASHTIYRNNTQMATVAGTAGTAPTRTYVIWANKNTSGTVGSFSARELGFVAYHQGLNTTEVGQMDAELNTLMTALGR